MTEPQLQESDSVGVGEAKLKATVTPSTWKGIAISMVAAFGRIAIALERIATVMERRQW